MVPRHSTFGYRNDRPPLEVLPREMSFMTRFEVLTR